VTVEAAFGIAALVVAMVVCVAGLTAVSMQVRCVDAAREAARLAARGDDRSAAAVGREASRRGASVEIRHQGGLVVARVTAKSALLPGLIIAAEAVSVVEPGPR